MPDNIITGPGRVRRKHEKPQRGNKNQLTIKQHVHSAAAIARFADERGNVAVLRKAVSKPFPVKATDPIFCVMRVWDQRFENNVRPIEDTFQRECDSILANHTVSNHQAVTEYLWLWQIRSSLRERPPADVILSGVGGVEWDDKKKQQEAEETIEAKHGAFLRRRTVPGRFGASVIAARHHHWNMALLRGLRWGVLRAAGTLRFLCPDRPAGELCIPLDRVTVLVAGYRDQEIGDATVDELNHAALQQAWDFIFGHPQDIRSVRR